VITAAEVGEVLGVGRTKVHELNGRGKLPAPVTVGARGLRWVRLEIEAWLLARRPASGELGAPVAPGAPGGPAPMMDRSRAHVAAATQLRRKWGPESPLAGPSRPIPFGVHIRRSDLLGARGPSTRASHASCTCSALRASW
jgi:predicted DNA-binding transcriptional regulator AlpA